MEENMYTRKHNKLSFMSFNIFGINIIYTAKYTNSKNKQYTKISGTKELHALRGFFCPPIRLKNKKLFFTKLFLLDY